MNQPKCTCATSGFMRETSFLRNALEDIEVRFAASKDQDSSESPLEHVQMPHYAAGLAVISGRSEVKNWMLGSHLVHQRVFRLGVGCGVFCADAKAFITGQISLVSGVAIQKLKTGVIDSEDWGYIAHAKKGIEESPLYVGNLPSSLESLKLSIRDYAAKCKAEDSDGDYAVFVFDLSRLIDEHTPLAKVLQELRELAAEIERQIIVVHDACAPSENSEGEIIWEYADSVLELEARADDMALLRELSRATKVTHALFTLRLIFDERRFLVRHDANSSTDSLSYEWSEEVGMGSFIL